MLTMMTIVMMVILLSNVLLTLHLYICYNILYYIWLITTGYVYIYVGILHYDICIYPFTHACGDNIIMK